MDYKLIRDKLKDIYEAFEIYNDPNIDRFINSITNDIANKLYGIIPDTIEVWGVDGSKFEVSPFSNYLVYYLIQLRCNDLETPWKDLILNSKFRFTICKSNNKFYFSIPEHIGKFLMKNNLGPFLFELLNGDMRDKPSLWGNSVEVVRQYIKKENSIYKKKDLFIETTNFDNGEDIFRYVRGAVCKYEPQVLFELDKDRKIKEKCKKYDISYLDVLYRLKEGSTFEESIKQGLLEKEKFGLIYMNKDRERYVDYNGKKHEALQVFIIKVIENEIEKEK